MASQKVTGWTKEEMLQKKHEHPDDHDHEFDDFYCGAKIPRQPEDYDGPQRFCRSYTRKHEESDGRYSRCRFHNGAAHGDWQSGTEAADEAGEGNVRAMKHGMYAEDTNLKENWSDADQKLFDTVMGWAEDFGFEEGSPPYVQLESLAMSKVREMRSEKYLDENGEIVEREQFNPETGEVSEWEEVHPLSDNVRLKKQTILKMMKELGLTPKAQSLMSESESKGSAADAVGEVVSSALDKEDGEYDPEQFSEDS